MTITKEIDATGLVLGMAKNQVEPGRGSERALTATVNNISGTIVVASSSVSVVAIIAAGMFGADTTDHEGMSPRHLAATGNHLSVVKDLLDLTENMNQASLDGRTALHFAAELGLYDMMSCSITRSQRYQDQPKERRRQHAAAPSRTLGQYSRHQEATRPRGRD